MNKSLFLLFATAILAHGLLHGQFPEAYSSSRIYHEMHKANSLGSILYIAAHPDDENTRLISYFENKLMARTAYLSLTRGDGGQNLIGTEIGAAIGVLRTQELLAARKIDGGEQFFTRAVDFGYSKSSIETLEKWDKEKVLADVVWVIRNFRPDALVTRFPPNNYAGHGHHEASALLAEEAFAAAGDANRFPEQLEFVETWQPTRLYFNTSSWWDKDLPERAKGNDNFVRANVGEYSALLGETYARIASRSRSQHKSQGFGSDVYYGLNIEYMEYVAGKKANEKNSILDGVEVGWSRIDASDVGAIFQKALDDFDHSAPEASVQAMLEALHLLSQKTPGPMRDHKIKEIEALILKMAGVYAEAVADDYYYTPGSEVNVRLNLVHQHSADIRLKDIEISGEASPAPQALAPGDLFTEEFRINIPKDAEYSNHYWLRKPYEALFDVSDYDLLGKAENPAALKMALHVEIEGYDIECDIPVRHKMVDPVKAVIYRPVQIVPDLTFGFAEDVIVSTDAQSKTLVLYVTNHRPDVEAVLSLNLPKGWSATPAKHMYSAGRKGTVSRLAFELKGAGEAESGNISINLDSSGQANAANWQLSEIDYDHFPNQLYMKPAQIGLQKFDLEKGHVSKIGYIEGPGDDVAKYLMAAGFEVDILGVETIQAGGLNEYDAIMTGIRAFNTRAELTFLNDALNAYVANGGTWIVQYNTSRGLKSEEIGPYPFTIGRERVSDETASPKFLVENHPVLNYPNPISQADFSNWVQERGLYFASEWDEAFTPIIGWSDPGEPERTGSLIVAPHGKGYFVYTGISFFRELPAGVPGAYRLLGNILNLRNGQGDKP
jgi:LmbE family N-acetylglucosaminyl deacetylase